jgi:hypothetical protein
MKIALTPVCLVIISSFFLGCTNNKPGPPITEVIIDPKNEVAISQSLTTDYFRSRKLVRLETTNESLIAGINRLIVYENRYYIFDHQSKSVFIFNKSGKYISKINSIGKGPGEYIQVSDFTIDVKNQRIVLLCDIPSCLIYYDINGQFLDQEKLRDFPLFIASDQDVLFFGNYSENYISIQNRGKYSEFLKIEDYLNDKLFYSPHPNIIRSNYTYFFTVYDNLVYMLTDDNVLPKYKMQFGNKAVDKSIIIENEVEEIMKICREEEKISRISDFRECNDYLTFRMSSYSRIAIYNKTEKICRLFSAFYDPETGLYLSNLIAHDGPGDEMIFEIDPMSFITNVLHIKDANEMAQNETYIKYKEEAEKLNLADNPVLMVYSLK